MNESIHYWMDVQQTCFVNKLTTIIDSVMRFSMLDVWCVLDGWWSMARGYEGPAHPSHVNGHRKFQVPQQNRARTTKLRIRILERARPQFRTISARELNAMTPTAPQQSKQGKLHHGTKRFWNDTDSVLYGDLILHRISIIIDCLINELINPSLAMSHEPWTVNNRLINWSIEYVLVTWWTNG